MLSKTFFYLALFEILAILFHLLLVLRSQWILGCSGEDLEFKQTVVRWGMANYALTCYYAIGVCLVDKDKKRGACHLHAIGLTLQVLQTLTTDVIVV